MLGKDKTSNNLFYSRILGSHSAGVFGEMKKLEFFIELKIGLCAKKFLLFIPDLK